MYGAIIHYELNWFDGGQPVYSGIATVSIMWIAKTVDIFRTNCYFNWWSILAFELQQTAHTVLITLRLLTASWSGRALLAARTAPGAAALSPPRPRPRHGGSGNDDMNLITDSGRNARSSHDIPYPLSSDRSLIIH